MQHSLERNLSSMQCPWVQEKYAVKHSVSSEFSFERPGIFKFVCLNISLLQSLLPHISLYLTSLLHRCPVSISPTIALGIYFFLELLSSLSFHSRRDDRIILVSTKNLEALIQSGGKEKTAVPRRNKCLKR